MANDAREKLAGILRLHTDELAQDVTRANEILARIGKGKDIGSQIAQNISDQIKKGIESGIKDAKIPNIGSGSSNKKNTDETALLRTYSEQAKLIKEIASAQARSLSVGSEQKKVYEQIAERKREELKASEASVSK